MTDKKVLKASALLLIVIAALALIVALLKMAIGIILPAGVTLKDSQWSAAVATWVGTVSAFLAFAGTIWIATSERRRRHRDERTKAELVATSFLLPIHRLIVILTTVRLAGSVVDQIVDEDAAVKAVKGLIDEMKLAVVWKVDELLPLLGLPNELISRMVTVESHNNIINSYLMVYMSHLRGEARENLLEIKVDMMTRISTAIENLEECRTHCLRHQRKLASLSSN